jgi:hypothetical protein
MNTLSLAAISRHTPSIIPVGLVRTDLAENGAYGTARNSSMALLMGSEYAREERSGGDGNIIVDCISMFFDERDKRSLKGGLVFPF